MKILKQWVWVLVSFWGLGVHAWADVQGVAALKAAFIFNFAVFTEWPHMGQTFDICVLGRDDLGEAVDGLSRKAIAGRPVRVHRLAVGTDALGDCRLVFVPALESPQLGAIVSRLAGTPTLIVSEGDLLKSAKPMIRLAFDQGRLVFDAYPDVARAHGLLLSSKMLRLARSVD